MSTPIENLRKHHKPCEPCIYTNHWFARTEGVHCLNCMYQWPCDTVAALDALEDGLHNLQARIEQADALAGALGELQATVQATCEGGQVDIPGLEILGEALDKADAALCAYREANRG